MHQHLFISYSTNDATEFALKLCDNLKAGPPAFSAWLDKRELQPGNDWDEQIVEAIKNCESMLFIMSRDSVSLGTVCKNEWTRAIKYKKPVIPLLLHADAEVPFQLENRQYLDFTGDFETALAKLRNHLQWMKSPEGQLRVVRDRLTDADRALRRTDDDEQMRRIKADITVLKKQLEIKEYVANDPDAAKERVKKAISAGIERERTPEKQPGGVSMTRFINPPPGIAPSYWQDRYRETELVGQFINDEAARLVTIVGRAGIGKTAMVCRLLKSLESNRLPDDLGALQVDGIVYLSERGSRKVTFMDLFADLCSLLPEAKAQELENLYRDAGITATAKMNALLRAFPRGRVLVLLDNFEDKMDYETRQIDDEEIDEVLRALLTAEHHGVKVLITTRIAPQYLALIEPQLQRVIRLDDGLDSPYAENILREMDYDGTVGLKDAPLELLTDARERTRGYPRALEALFAILSADREATLPEILADAEQTLPEHVVEKMVGEAFNRLDPDARKVMQALAVYGSPISNVAVDYLLQPYVDGCNSVMVLNRLVNMQFVRKEKQHYYLHPVDREYALHTIQKGVPGDRHLYGEYRVFSRFALLHRGAEFFKEIRLPRENWKKLEDLAPQLAEFEMRFSGKEYNIAAGVLLEIDFDYLMLWGHYKLLIALHERLQGRIDNKELLHKSVGNLGSAYYNIGQYHKTIVCYKKALEIARKQENHLSEGVWLGNLGICYDNLGDTGRAIKYLEQALAIIRETGNKIGEGPALDNLGLCYSALGDTHCAIEYHEQALSISRKAGNKSGEGDALGNLGLCHSDLGNTRRAIEYHEQALRIARKIGNKRSEGAALCNLGLCYYNYGRISQAIDNHKQALVISREIGNRRSETIQLINLGEITFNENQFKEAVEILLQSIVIADEIKFNQARNEARVSLAIAYLYSNELSAALTTINEALEFDHLPNNHNIHRLLGCIHLHKENIQTSIDSFTTAIAEANILIDKSSQNYLALDSKSFSITGIALCKNDKTLLETARETFLTTREINSDAGYIKRLQRLFDKLAEKDEQGFLNRFWEGVTTGSGK